jgi:hypothetical protein
MPYIVKSPLKSWEGEFSLPDPDEFNRSQWEVYKAAVNKPKRKSYAYIHLYSYAGLELIQGFGQWNLSVPLAEVMSWEDSPEAEKTKLVAWLAKEMRQYIESVIDPKE